MASSSQRGRDEPALSEGTIVSYSRAALVQSAHEFLSRRPAATLAGVARFCQVSVATLSRAVQTELGRTYRAWQLELLESAARERLNERPPRSIKEISVELGFARSSSFARWSRRHLGSAPSAYRERTPSPITSVVPLGSPGPHSRGVRNGPRRA